ncbi:MAG: hypothetical protein M0Z95_25645 [Actinomycetota bacterium]|jgi:hypothetical protein|nr:hypothetical protein [Actinomycetota bacterium]
MTANIVILQLAVLAVILESDLGRRKIGWVRILRPVVTIVVIVPFFFTTLPAAPNDLLLQGTGALAGALLGLASVSSAVVWVGYEPAWRSRWLRSARTRSGPAAVSHAGVGYAAIWIAVSAARLGFAYGAQHLFPAELGRFLADYSLSQNALVNAFIFLSLGMDLFRSVGLWTRGRRARLAEEVPAAAVAVGMVR